MDVVQPQSAVADHPSVRPGPIDPMPETEAASTSATVSGAMSAKRSASEAFDGSDSDEEKTTAHKKMKENDAPAYGSGGGGSGDEEAKGVDGTALADGLEEELQCGCCSAIVYRPVVVAPCQHFFCGSCVTLWIKNGGTSCPACRTISSSVSFSRPIEKVVDILLRHAPSKARSVSERMQADAIYTPGLHLRIPSPRQASPEPAVPTNNALYVRPCPHCLPGNQWGWRCPRPIVDPDMDPNNAWLVEDGNPPGHEVCGNCENVLALGAPTTTRCDFCQVAFCGINVPQRCIAAPLQLQHPHGLADLSDLIQCGEVYDCFDGNTVEVDIMLDYLNAQGLTPRHIYREIVSYIQGQPRQFAPLIESDLFTESNGAIGGIDPDPNAPRTRICRICATEVLLFGLRDWWVRERKKGFLEEHVMARPDCAEGAQCPRQKDHAHAKEFNHIFASQDPQPAVEPAPQPAPVPAPQVQPNPQSYAELPPLEPVLPPRAPSAGEDSEPVDHPPVYPPLLVPMAEVPAYAVDPHPSGYSSAPSSQDFRDEVDALL